MAGEVGKQSTIYGIQGAASGAMVGATTGMTVAAGGAAAGAATGAAAGSVVPGLGTAIGAIIGAGVGIIAGAFSGSKQKKSKKYQKLAAQVQQQREDNQDYEKFLQLVRQQRIARASTLSQAVASGLDYSSAVSGAVSGQQSQTAHGINYLAEDRRLQELYLSYMSRAGVASSIAKDINTGFNVANKLAQTYAILNAKRAGEQDALKELQSKQQVSQSINGETRPGVTGTNDMTISYN